MALIMNGGGGFNIELTAGYYINNADSSATPTAFPVVESSGVAHSFFACVKGYTSMTYTGQAISDAWLGIKADGSIEHFSGTVNNPVDISNYDYVSIFDYGNGSNFAVTYSFS